MALYVCLSVCLSSSQSSAWCHHLCRQCQCICGVMDAAIVWREQCGDVLHSCDSVLEHVPHLVLGGGVSGRDITQCGVFSDRWVELLTGKLTWHISKSYSVYSIPSFYIFAAGLIPYIVSVSAVFDAGEVLGPSLMRMFFTKQGGEIADILTANLI